ncbi:MAG: DNA topoisomerase, partial [Erysipelotrichaceae bacterium]
VTLTQNGLDFAATGSHLKFDGYLRVYSEYEQTKDRMLPELGEGEKLDSKSVEGKQHFTEPPLRYSEARLIKAMEEKGIGRPSTYATIIDTLQQRMYVTLEKQGTQKTKMFIPTPQGILTDEQLELHFPSVINVGYTAEMENELDEIADGKRDSITSLRTFYDTFSPLISKANADMEKKAPELTGENCPDCGKPLVFRAGRFGRFISCSTYPECKYTAKIASDKPAAELTDKICPECGSFLVKRKSRYGRFFYGCSSFPKCKYLENIPYKKKSDEAEEA